MGKEKVDATLAPIRANKAMKQAELEIAKMEEEIANQEAKVYELCTKIDLDFHAIIEAQDKHALTERKIEQFKKLIKEMFPKNKSK